MASPAVSPARLTFEKDGKFLDGGLAAGIEIDATRSLAVAEAIATNTAFPPGPIALGNIRARVSASHDIQLANGAKGSISFGAGGGVKTGIGVYSDPQRMLDDLGVNNPTIREIDIVSSGAARYLALHWGYDLKGSTAGSLALQPGAAVDFGVEGSRDKLFVLIRAYKNDPKARDAVEDLLDSWVLPRRVSALDHLAPGTWILTEVNGEIGARIGAQFGFDYNWIRNVNLQGLSGDIGLKVQAAAEVSLGFHFGGKFALVLGRESLDPKDKHFRLRLYKLRKRGWNFAMNAGVEVTPSSGELLPDQLDQFIAGVFGVSGQQIVSDLQIVRKWTDPDQSLSTLASDFLVDFAENTLKKEGIDARKIFTEAQNRILGFLDQWEELGEKIGDQAAGLLWSVAGGQDQKTAKAFRKAIKAFAAKDDARLENLIRSAISDVNFFKSPEGRWLAAVASNRLVDLLADGEGIRKVREASQLALEILSGRVFDSLLGYVDKKLNIDDIRNASFDKLSNQLKAKLADFLEEPITALRLDEIRKAIDILDQKAQEIYRQGVKALNSKYAFSLAYTYQTASAKSALVDASFDMGEDSGESARLLQHAIDGNLKEILVNPNPKVKLHEALLTHQIERQSSLNVTLPFYSSTTEKLNTSLAQMKVEEENGRVLAYRLEAEDAVTRVNRWKSELSASLVLPTMPHTRVRFHGSAGADPSSASISYIFRQATSGMTTAHLENQLSGLTPVYFAKEFSSSETVDAASVQEWVTDFDKLTDQLKGNQTGEIGDTLLSMQVGLPSKVLAAWLKAPADKKDPAYRRMSRNIQAALRGFVPYSYFQDLKHYRAANSAAAAVLVYASLPVAHDIEIGRSGLLFNHGDDFYPDFFDNSLRRAAVLHSRTQTALARRMERVSQMLSRSEGFRGQAKFYASEERGEITKSALGGVGARLLENSLLGSEARVVRGAVKAGREISEFVQLGGEDPEKALEALASFGARLTSTFNDSMSDLFDPDHNKELLKNLGLVVFLEASRALDPALAGSRPAAILDVRVLQDGQTFPPAGYLDTGVLPPDLDVPLAQRVVGAA